MATKVLAPARPATLAAQVLTSVRHATTAYLFFRKTSHERGAPRRCTFFSKTSHERGALRRRTFFFRRPRTSGARYDGATFFSFTTLAASRETTSSTHSHRRPRIRMRTSATRLQAQLRRKATNHALRHFVYSFFHQSNTDTLLRGRATGKRDRNANE